MSTLRGLDLFCGGGGFALALRSAGVSVVWANDTDAAARKTYAANLGHVPDARDIRRIPASQIPATDLLTAGFPCPPYSLSGIAKRNSLGRASGLADSAQGRLVFEVARIVRARRPRAFVLENVRNLAYHAQGLTLESMLRPFQRLGYSIHWRVLDSARMVPQHRERVYIVGFRARAAAVRFRWPTLRASRLRTLADLLDPDPPAKYRLGAKTWACLKRHRAHHEARGQGFGFTLADPAGIARTLSARYHKDGAEILVPWKTGGRPRRLTPRECARLQGFPDSFWISVSDTQAYRQFGNAVTVPVAAAVMRAVVRALCE